MRAKPLILAVITLALVIAAWQVSVNKAPQTEITRGSLFPGVLERLNDVNRLEIKSAKHALTLKRDGEAWVIASKDGFPATFANVKRTLLQAASLVIVEKKTDRPESYTRIGVEEIADDKAAGTLLEAYTSDDKRLLGLIVGKPRETAGGQHYVRRVGEAQAWLVDGELTLDADPIAWLSAEIVDIDTARVRQLTLRQGDAPPVVIRKLEAKDNFFSLADVPAGFEAKSKATVSSIGALLLDLRFNDVMAASKVDGLTPVREAEIQTFDGLAATVTQFDIDGKSWSRFAFRYDAALAVDPATPTAGEPPAAKNETVDEAKATSGAKAPDADTGTKEPAETTEQLAVRLNSVTANWVYLLPEYKQRMLTRRLDDLVQKPPAKTAGKTAP